MIFYILKKKSIEYGKDMVYKALGVDNIQYIADTNQLF